MVLHDLLLLSCLQLKLLLSVPMVLIFLLPDPLLLTCLRLHLLLTNSLVVELLLSDLLLLGLMALLSFLLLHTVLLS